VIETSGHSLEVYEPFGNDNRIPCFQLLPEELELAERLTANLANKK
jgi:hypothetical protein